MVDFFSILIPVTLLFAFLRLCMTQIRWMWKISLHSLSGFLSLWLLNLISGITGIFLPINLLTAFTAGFLGLPGIALLTLVQIIP